VKETAGGSQGYGAVFARLYDQRWSEFAVRHAPAIRALYVGWTSRAGPTPPPP
jgi:hypothetical protein